MLKTFVTETPLNSACITPARPYVIVGGGQDAMSVTTTSTRSGKFETRFWHRVFEEEVGRVKGHLWVVLKDGAGRASRADREASAAAQSTLLPYTLQARRLRRVARTDTSVCTG